jgi:tRNA(Arg) A34 adenosine deaminase TadA
MNNKLIQIAIKQAKKSHMYHQHGAVLFERNQIVDLGHNRGDRLRLQKQYGMCSTHAEMDCSRRLLRLQWIKEN